jgi:carboxymethylenebutenolidase
LFSAPRAFGDVPTRLFVPEGEGPFPLVLFYMDAPGLRPALDAMAARWVDQGYAVLQPDLYWRSGEYAPFDVPTMFSDPAQRSRVFALMNGFSPDDVVADTRALLASAEADLRLRTDRVGLVGYCMGGRQAFVVACALGDRIAVCAPIHAGGLVTAQNSPHTRVSGLRCPVYLGVADADNSCTPEHQATLRAALDEIGAEYQLELYVGARHGFAVPDFPVFDADAAERHWSRLFQWFGEAFGR